jgi:hypothetical protein
MIRMVMVVVRTAAMLNKIQFGVSAALGDAGGRGYLVTMVLTASSEPVGLIMNQNKTLVMLTIQMDYYNGVS